MDHFLMGYRVLYKMLCGTVMIGRLSDSMYSRDSKDPYNPIFFLTIQYGILKDP